MSSSTWSPLCLCSIFWVPSQACCRGSFWVPGCWWEAQLAPYLHLHHGSHQPEYSVHFQTPLICLPQIQIGSSFPYAGIPGRKEDLPGEGGKVQSFYPKHVRNEVIWAIPPTPHRISSELQPAEGIDLELQSSWKVLQRVGNSFTEELKPVSNLSTFQSKLFWRLFLPRVT